METVKGNKPMIKKERKGGTLFRGRITIYLTLLTLSQLASMAAYAASKMEVSKTVFDFGHINEGLPAIATVHLKNVGDGYVVIKEVTCS
jgi:hypothetical protein